MLRTRSITTIGTVMALAVPAAAGAQQQDWRAPDRAAAPPEGLIVAVQAQDRRAPDQVDAGRTASATPAARVVPAVAPPATSGANGFEWGDAGLGAAGMLGIVGLVGGGLVLTARRRHDHHSFSPSH
jgi:hypothetical protein